MEHTQDCIEDTAKQKLLRELYVRFWPDYCRGCNGYGVLGFGSIVPQKNTEEPCPNCTAQGKCPRCGKAGLTSEALGDGDTGAGPCRFCTWNYEDGLPQEGMCLCHLDPFHILAEEFIMAQVVEPTKKLAIVDLDKVVADSSARFAQAMRPNGSTNWYLALDPARVKLDELIVGADKALAIIQNQGFDLVFCTGRPEDMRNATEAWLAQHGIATYEMVMRSNGDYSKAPKFKQSKVPEIIAEKQPYTLIFIDALIAEYPDLLGPIDSCQYACYVSLDDYVANSDFSGMRRNILGDSDGQA